MVHFTFGIECHVQYFAVTSISFLRQWISNNRQPRLPVLVFQEDFNEIQDSVQHPCPQFQDFSGPKRWKPKIQDFSRLVGTLIEDSLQCVFMKVFDVVLCRWETNKTASISTTSDLSTAHKELFSLHW